MVGEPGAGVRVVEQFVDHCREAGDVRGAGGLPGGEQPGPQRAGGRHVAGHGRRARDQLVLVQEALERGRGHDPLVRHRQSRGGVHQVGGEHEGGRGVMSKNQLDS